MDEILYTPADYYKHLYEAECKLNDNLVRIMRERANADRGLTPKGKHPGYIVLSSQETVFRDSLGKSAKLWRTSLQTPFAANISPDALTARLSADRSSILGDLQICTSDVDHTTMRADYRSGLWEVQIYHTRPCVVPPDMLPSFH